MKLLVHTKSNISLRRVCFPYLIPRDLRFKHKRSQANRPGVVLQTARWMAVCPSKKLQTGPHLSQTRKAPTCKQRTSTFLGAGSKMQDLRLHRKASWESWIQAPKAFAFLSTLGGGVLGWPGNRGSGRKVFVNTLNPR